MALTFRAPQAFFESTFVPPCCIITGRTDNLRAAEIRLERFQGKSSWRRLDFDLPKPHKIRTKFWLGLERTEFFVLLGVALLFGGALAQAELRFGPAVALGVFCISSVAVFALMVWIRRLMTGPNDPRLTLFVTKTNTLPMIWRGGLLLCQTGAWIAPCMFGVLFACAAYLHVMQPGRMLLPLPGFSIRELMAVFVGSFLLARLGDWLRACVYPKFDYQPGTGTIQVRFPRRALGIYERYNQAFELWKQSLPADQQPASPAMEEAWTEAIVPTWDHTTGNP